MKIIIPCIISFIFTAAITPLVISLAKACNCLDIPGGRRLHHKTTPRLGGVAFFAGVLPFLVMENQGGVLTSYIVASCLLVGMGMMDDIVSLGWKPKLAVMTTSASIVIFGGNISVHHIGNYGFLGRIDLGWFSIPFTFVSIIGITNAINLLDGLNGLAGGVSLLGFLFMGIAALLAGNIMAAVICFAFVGALGAFLLYNFPNARIFMGDTGSLFLGFSLACTAILLTQDATSPVEAMFPALVLLIPIFDTLRVLLVRLLNGRNPFKADTLHLHYLIVQKNISPVYVTLMFWSLTAVFGGIALALKNSTSMPYLTAVLSASLSLTLFATALMQGRQLQPLINRISALTKLFSATKAQKTTSNLLKKDHCETPTSTDMESISAGITLLNDCTLDLARKGGLSTLKWIVVLGVVLLTAQMVVGKSTVITTGPDKQDAQSSPDKKAMLSRHTQANIWQAEAAKKSTHLIKKPDAESIAK